MALISTRFDRVGLLSFWNCIASLFVGPMAFSEDHRNARSPETNGTGAEEFSLSVNGSDATFASGQENGANIVEWTLDIESSWLEDLLAEINDDDVFYDVGANLGVYSCFVVNELETGEVIAFEPYPPNTRQLRDNLSRNGGNYRVVQKALSNEEGEIDFTPTEGVSVGHATGTIAPDGGGGEATIETVQADRVIDDRSFPSPDVVKIDVEGSEPLVLDGMQETLSAPSCRLLYCEVHLPKDGRPSVRDYGYSPESVKELIEDAGFRIDSQERRNQELHVKAVR